MEFNSVFNIIDSENREGQMKEKFNQSQVTKNKVKMTIDNLKQFILF